MVEDLSLLLRDVTAAESAERQGSHGELQALQLGTCTPEGWPHLSLLSAGEVLPTARDEVALCLWASSTTTRNLQSCGQALLQFVRQGVVFKAQLAVRALGPIVVEGSRYEAFLGSAVDIRRDAVPYAEVLGGLRYRLTDAGATTQRWRAQIAALRAALEERPTP